MDNMQNPPSDALHTAEADVAALPAQPADAMPGNRAQSAASRREAWRALGVAGVCLLFWQVTLLIPSGSIAVVWITTLLYLALALLFTVQSARAMQSRTALLVGLVISGGLTLPSVLLPILAVRFPEWSGWAALAPTYRVYRHLLYGTVPGLGGLVMIWFAASLGAWISKLVREIKILLPMAVALACVDLYVVFGGGMVKQANTGHAPVAQAAMKALTVSLPTTHPKSGAAPMQLAVGFADFLFVALFFACFARFRVPSRQTFVVLCTALIGYMFYVGLTGVDLPALVPIAIVVIGMNLRRFRYERSEAFALLYAGLIVLAVVGGMFLFSRH